MKIKVSKHKLNIHYRGSPRGGRTQQHAYCLRYAHSQHIESHLGKKQQQAKIPIAFLFSQLHFNNVTSHALFYGGHLVMRRKRCAVQNQGITLSKMFCLIRYWVFWLPARVNFRVFLSLYGENSVLSKGYLKIIFVCRSESGMQARGYVKIHVGKCLFQGRTGLLILFLLAATYI